MWIFVYNLAILAVNRHFCNFRQIRHFRQSRHFQKGPFAMWFEFLFTIWWLIAISAIVAKYAIFAIGCISWHNHDVNNTVPAMSAEPTVSKMTIVL